MIGYYKLDGNTTDFFGNDGVLSGATWSTDKDNNPTSALLFDGINDTCDMTLTTVYNNFAVALWVNPTGTITIVTEANTGETGYSG